MDEAKAGSKDATARADAIEAVIANVKRLIKDAELLIDSGSSGSALSLAILAFEEAGKGYVIELTLDKPEALHSKHEFRHLAALIALDASLMQKYEIDLSVCAAKIRERLQKKMVKKSKGWPVLPPMADELRDDLRRELTPQFQKMTAEEFRLFWLESRWLAKIAFVVHNGGLEKLRQSGLYLDTNANFSIASSPMAVEPIEAERWIWAASRVLNLLEHGIYFQAYSPLSELITSAAGVDEKAKEIMEALKITADLLPDPT